MLHMHVTQRDGVTSGKSIFVYYISTLEQVARKARQWPSGLGQNLHLLAALPASPVRLKNK